MRRSRRKKEAQGERAAGGRGHRGDPQPHLTADQRLAPHIHRPPDFLSPLVWLVSGSCLLFLFLPFLPPSLHPYLTPSFPSPPGIDLAPLKFWDHSCPQGEQKVPTELAGLAYFCATAWAVAYQDPPSVLGILQARILEWIARPSSKESSQPRDQTQVCYVPPSLAGGFFTTSATWEALSYLLLPHISLPLFHKLNAVSQFINSVLFS